jgi:D-alanine-D-alanine ligase
MKVAVVRNRSREGVISRFGSSSPETYGRRTVRQVVDALRAGGHTVAVLEGDKTLLAGLERFITASTHEARPPALVFNMAYGIQGESRYSHIPAMLELAGVPYTGASPLGHGVSLDKPTAKRLMVTADIPTPEFTVMSRAQALPTELRFPVVVKPRRESTSYGLALAQTPAELRQAVATVVDRYGQEALVEQYIEGREICVALLGNDPVEALPPVELSFAGRGLQLMTCDDKYHRRLDEPAKLCPAPLPRTLERAIEKIACATFHECHARDYARVDIRIDHSGRPWVLEINSMASLGARGSYVHAARVGGYAFDELVNEIVDVTHRRYFGTPAPRSSDAADAFRAQASGAYGRARTLAIPSIQG